MGSHVNGCRLSAQKNAPCLSAEVWSDWVETGTGDWCSSGARVWGHRVRALVECLSQLLFLCYFFLILCNSFSLVTLCFPLFTETSATTKSLRLLLMPSKACVHSTLCKCVACQNVCVEFNQTMPNHVQLDQLFQSKYLYSSRASPSISAWQLKTVTLAWNISTICINLFDLDFHYCKYCFLWPTGCCMGIRSQSYRKECSMGSMPSSCCKFDKILESVYKFHNPGQGDNHRRACNLHQFGLIQYFTGVEMCFVWLALMSVFFFLCVLFPLLSPDYWMPIKYTASVLMHSKTCRIFPCCPSMTIKSRL